MTKTPVLILIALLALTATAAAQPGDPTGPEVVVNPKAAGELKGIDLTGPGGEETRVEAPIIPEASSRDRDLGRGLAHEARQANELVDRHRPRSKDSQTLFGVAIACGAALVLVLGLVLGRRRGVPRG